MIYRIGIVVKQVGAVHARLRVQKKRSIAIIGSGISGLSAAWLLSQTNKVTLFEAGQRPGGHSNTVSVPTESGLVAVDTGFIVYNTKAYPNLVALFEHLNVATAPSDMGFAVSLNDGAYEYSGDGLRGLFGQPTNLLRPSHWRMIADLLRFFRNAQTMADHGTDDGQSLGAYLKSNNYSQSFIDDHIRPMGAAIWSTPAAEILQYPAAAFARFFSNHGLLQVSNRPQWRTVVGGSQTYVNRLLEATDCRLQVNCSVQAIVRSDDSVSIVHSGGTDVFDTCVVAAHADEALALLADPDKLETSLLSAFGYTNNRAVLHSDPSFMPRRTNLWSSWNYLSELEQSDGLSLTYWMNKLQPLTTEQNMFVTLNPRKNISANLVHYTCNYSHPIFNQAALDAQKQLWSLQGRRRTWFCGSYFGSGFHEDGIQAGLAVAEEIGSANRPWKVENQSGRIIVTPRQPFLLPEAAE